MRATAKWIIGAFAGVGALLLGGMPLAAIGKIHGRGDAVAVALGILIAVTGVSWAIWHTSEALTPPVTTLAGLSERPLRPLRVLLETNPAAFFGGFGGTEPELRQHLIRDAAVVERLRHMIPRETSHERRLALEVALADAQDNLARGRQVQRRLIEFIHTWQVRQALRRARLHTLVGAVVSVVGILVFLSATASPPAP